jgi:5'(3')-deoxyribonucleotidase
MQKKKIAVDIDLVCTEDLGNRWWDYLVMLWKDHLTDDNYYQFVKDYENGCAEYNLTKYFNLPDYADPMLFWKQDNLYDEEPLAEGCYEVVKNLWQAGFEIYFISVTEPAHMQSKKDYLARSFDFMDNINFVATDAKDCMDGCFAIVDDRLDNLNGFENNDTLRILFDTPYKQDVESTQDYKLAKNWQDVEDFICQRMEAL